ncbi:hypothetical protein [Thalassospira alkalitolerans]|uniref:hypothetical protein n=1 Tax=Thalassospira alkalitolerans TaxID=1293890 RepID=UPI003AA956FE
MSFFNSVGKFFRDAGTSIGRIVTDSAIDIANVATGFQFSKDMETAKKAMTDVGFKSASDAIKDNHYGHLKELGKTAKKKNDEIEKRTNDFKALDTRFTSRLDTYGVLLSDLNRLINLGETVRAALKAESQLSSIPYEMPPEFPSPKQFQMTKSVAIEAIEIAQLSSDGLSAAALATWSGTKLGTKLAKSAASVGRSARIASTASKASAALLVVSVGLDIGMSIAILEQQSKELPKFISERDEDLRLLETERTSLQTKFDAVEAGIKSMLAITDPALSEESWSDWLDKRKRQLRDILYQSVSEKTFYEGAENIARQNSGKSERVRIKEIHATYPALNRKTIKAIITLIDAKAENTAAA